MRSYTHGIVGYLLYLRGTHQERMFALIGAILPDVFLAIGFIFHVVPNEFLHTLFHHSFLHTITEYMHSFLISIPLLFISWLFYKKATSFFVGMGSHAILDMITHQQSSYNYFLPLPMEPFVGVVSYTSAWFTILEHLFVFAFIALIIKQRCARSYIKE